MKNTIQQAIDEARINVRLCEMTARIKEHFQTIERRMHKRQQPWGGNLSVLDEESTKRSTTIRRSLAFEKVMLEMPIDIEDYDLIVGNCVQNDTIIRCAFPIFLKNEELGKCTIHMSHKCPDYETLLKKGLRQIIEELEAGIPEVKAIPFDDIRQQKLDFIEAAKREVNGVIEMAHRYAALAEKKAAAEHNEVRKQELLDIARVCRRVPEFPAETLQEAIQSVWFINYAIFETMTNISIGHIDAILNPYFEHEWKNGTITLEQAQELVDCFCLHVNDRAQIDPKNYIADQKSLTGAPQQCMMNYGYGFVTAIENDNSDAINHWGQNILISGLNPDGSDGTNALTYMFLNAHQKFSMTSPVLTVRLHKASPKELLDRVAVVLKTGGGMPYINNDDIIVDAYEKLGIAREDGCRYANSNCWETLIQGMSNQEMIRGLNFLYFLELALGRGEAFVYKGGAAKGFKPDRNDPTTFSGWVQPYNPMVDGVDTGDVNGFSTFDDLMQAWKVQMDYMLKSSMGNIAHAVLTEGSHGPLSSVPILSMLTRDCVKKVLDITHLGARYNLWHLMGEAVSNAADAAAAIKKFVYEDKMLTLKQLVKILKSNWEGEEGELWRQRFINEAPKFGNNIDEVDSIAAEMVDYFLERGKYHAKKYYPDIIFSPCIGTFSWIISIGKRIGASADGRMSQEYISANMSPVPGRDLSGPTSAFHSYLKLNTSTMAAGAPIDLRLSMNGLEGEEGTKRIGGLIKTFLEEGGNMMTLTITSAEELRRAMENPEKYRGLRVRMGGWSAYYVLLSKEAQKVHLRRVEHGLA